MTALGAALAKAARAAFAGLTATAIGCGYSPVYGGDRPAPEPCTVVVVGSNVPDAVASDEVGAGMREELARSAALASGSAYPRCEIEVLRADEAAEGIGATPNADGRFMPEARATRVAIVARAWFVRRKDAPRERDTGDVRASEVVTVAADARAAGFRHTDALRAAGRRTGRKLGSRILGLPAVSDD